jgi:hypothetical protein
MTLRLLEEANGKVTMKKTQVYMWQKCFGDSDVSGDDLPYR